MRYGCKSGGTKRLVDVNHTHEHNKYNGYMDGLVYCGNNCPSFVSAKISSIITQRRVHANLPAPVAPIAACRSKTICNEQFKIKELDGPENMTVSASICQGKRFSSKSFLRPPKTTGQRTSMHTHPSSSSTSLTILSRSPRCWEFFRLSLRRLGIAVGTKKRAGVVLEALDSVRIIPGRSQPGQVVSLCWAPERQGKGEPQV